MISTLSLCYMTVSDTCYVFKICRRTFAKCPEKAPTRILIVKAQVSVFNKEKVLVKAL